jgi:hypothetical protein
MGFSQQSFVELGKLVMSIGLVNEVPKHPLLLVEGMGKVCEVFITIKISSGQQLLVLEGGVCVDDQVGRLDDTFLVANAVVNDGVSLG